MQSSPHRTARGHEEPFACQFSIFLVNRVGQMRDLMSMCAEKELDMVGMSVVDSTDWAVIRAIFSDANRAREVLKQEHMAFTETEVILVELPGDNSMTEICGHLLRGEINIHFAFPLLIRRHENPLMAIHVDDPVLAKQILIRHGMTLLGDEDLADPKF
ncbi:MAG: acetolactate synthase [Phycisphaerae bacterium]